MNGKMVKCMKEILKQENLTVLAKFIIQTEKLFKEFGKMVKMFKLPILIKRK